MCVCLLVIVYVCDVRSRKYLESRVDGLPTKQSFVVSVLISSDLSAMLIALASHLPLSLLYFIILTTSVACDASSGGPPWCSQSTSLLLAIIALLADTSFKLCLSVVRLFDNIYRHCYQTHRICRHTVAQTLLQSSCVLLFTGVLVLLVTMVTASSWRHVDSETSGPCSSFYRLRLG